LKPSDTRVYVLTRS